MMKTPVVLDPLFLAGSARRMQETLVEPDNSHLPKLGGTARRRRRNPARSAAVACDLPKVWA